ncbi:PKD domain-containing protein [Salinivirga cyanobacteriivorans]
MKIRKMMYHVLTLSFLATVLFFLNSCENDETDTETPEIVADAGDDIQTEVDQEVNLDASGSSTTSGTLSYVWEIASAPNGSSAVINDITSEIATFTPDVEGEYNISLTASVDETSQSDDLTVTATAAGPVELSCSDINEEMTLENISDGVDYYVPCMIEVNAGLIIEPGVTIEFAQEAGFEIQDYGDAQGYISAIGSETDSIRFTGELKTEGAWNQIQMKSNDLRNAMEYCVVEYAGNSDGSSAAIHLDEGKLELKNSTIQKNSSYGLFIDNSSNISGFANNTITANQNYPLHIAANQVAQLDGTNSSYTGNMSDGGESRDEIYVFSNSIYERGYITGQDVHVWENPGVPFYINELVYVGETDEGALRIMEGCDISFGQNYGFWVDEYNASFEVLGTSSEQVTIRGRSGQGSWNGIYLNTNNTANSIEYAVITDGGQEAVGHWFDNPANINLGYSGSNVYLNLSNVEINNSGGCGIAEGGGTIDLTLNNVTYSGNAGNDYCN